MKLGQLARKLSIQATDLIRFIQEELSVTIDPAPNAEIPAEILPEIYQHFESKKENLSSSDEEILTEADLNIKDGVITAPKVEVQGVKVVGKIDLPEPKVEEPSEEEKEEEKDAGKETSTQKSRPKRRDRRERKRKPKRTLTYQEQQEQEKQAHQQKMEQKRAAEKKRKKEHYKQLMEQRQDSVSSRRLTKKKLAKEQERLAAQKRAEEAPQGLWAKFIYWLNN